MYRTLAEREERGERMQSRMELVNAEDGSSQSVNSAETDNVGKAGVENADMEKILRNSRRKVQWESMREMPCKIVPDWTGR